VEVVTSAAKFGASCRASCRASCGAQLGEAALADWKKGSGEEVCEIEVSIDIQHRFNSVPARLSDG
jgi:hypothetical protein